MFTAITAVPTVNAVIYTDNFLLCVLNRIHRSYKTKKKPCTAVTAVTAVFGQKIIAMNIAKIKLQPQ